MDLPSFQLADDASQHCIAPHITEFGYGAEAIRNILNEHKGWLSWVSQSSSLNFIVHVNLLTPNLHRFRIIKEEEELESMRRAAKISCHGFNDVIQRIKLFRSEQEIHNHFEYVCRQQGASKLAYVPVVAGSGENSCIIHYTRNDQPLR
jgi:Xaa-Pro aminopeptidase